MRRIADFEKVLRSYIGTPFHHAGRVPGPLGGLDCGGMVTVAMTELGMAVVDQTKYAPGDGLVQLKETLAANCAEKPKDAVLEPGDLILLRGRHMYHHLVYYTRANTIIHAWQTTGVNKVVETSMMESWNNDIESLWRIRELEPWQQ